jgi:SAM-dependent methyltransferase
VPSLRSRLAARLYAEILIAQSDPFVRDRARFVGEKLVKGPCSTLDAGCGNGVFTFLAASLGHQVIGLNYDAREVTRAQQRADRIGSGAITFVNGDVVDVGRHLEDSQKFDFILLLEVIEHIDNDGAALAGLAERLRPGGILVLTTPTDTHRALPFEDDLQVLKGGHVRWGYSDAAITELMRTSGLEPSTPELLSGPASRLAMRSHLRAKSRFGKLGGWSLASSLRLLRFTDRLRTPNAEVFHCIGVVGTRVDES